MSKMLVNFLIIHVFIHFFARYLIICSVITIISVTFSFIFIYLFCSVVYFSIAFFCECACTRVYIVVTPYTFSIRTRF